MLKICHIVSGLPRDCARIFFRQSISLVKAGYEVSILINDGEKDEFVNDIMIFNHGHQFKSRLNDILFAKKYFSRKALEIDADIYQLHAPELIPLGLYLKKLGKIVFYDAHEDLPRDILEKRSIPKIIRPFLSKFIEWYMKNTLNKFDEVFTVTPHIVNNLKKIINNVTMITNFPLIDNMQIFDFNDYNLRDNNLCYVGTVYSYSNQEVLFDVMSRVNDINYLIAGNGDFLSTSINYQNLKSQDRIKFLGKLSKDKLNTLYNQCIAGYVLYDYHRNLGYNIGSFGTNKLFEYMIAGLPVICTDFELWKNIIDKYDCGIYVEPGKADQLENAISFLTSNKQKAYEMGQNAINAVVKEYNWLEQEKIYLNVFSKYVKVV